MPKTILYFLFLTLMYINTFGQQPIYISGKIFDSSTNEPIGFVNIGIEGTLTGTASNNNGEFALKIPLEFAEKNLYFSAIGYENYSFHLPDFLKNNHKSIKLTPQSYDISDIEINTASKVLYRIIRDAALAINSYYIKKPYALKALYKNESYINQTLSKKRDALVQITDLTGYGNRANSQVSRNYNFINVQRNFDISGLNDGTTLMDDLLSLDIARKSGNILDTTFLSQYDLNLIGESTINEDSVWVIAFSLERPDLSHTGDFYAKKYSGTLFISKKNKVLLKAEANIKTSQNSDMGRSIAIESKLAQKDVIYNYSVTYKTSQAGYMLDQIFLHKNYTDTKGQEAKITASLLVLDVNFTNPVMLTKRQYFEKMISDPNFWTNIKNQFQNNILEK